MKHKLKISSNRLIKDDFIAQNTVLAKKIFFFHLGLGGKRAISSISVNGIDKPRITKEIL